MRKILVLFGALLVALVSGAPGQSPDAEPFFHNWSQWRGPAGLGISPEKNFPLVWGPEQNVRWKTPIPGRGHSSPIVWKNRVFLTTSIQGPVVAGAEAVVHYREGQPYVHPQSEGASHSYKLNLICLDRSTGEVLWEKTAYQGTPYDNRHQRNTYASATPATDGRYIYVFFDAEGLYCFDLDGSLVWKKMLGPIAKGGMGNGMSPVLFQDLVIVQVDREGLGQSTDPDRPTGIPGRDGPRIYGENSFIAAFEKSSGREVWRTARNHRRSWATPLLIETPSRFELIASGAESVVAYDPATGQELWTAPGVVSHPIPSPVAGEGMVFVSAGSGKKVASAIRLGGAGELAGTDKILWTYSKGTAYVPSPILYDGLLYLVSDKGIITCLDPLTGEVRYEGGRVPVAATFKASPVAFDGKILLSSEAGDTFVVKAGPEHSILAVNSLGEAIWASPALSNGQIFIRTEKHLFCLEDLVRTSTETALLRPR